LYHFDKLCLIVAIINLPNQWEDAKMIKLPKPAKAWEAPY